MKRSLPSSPSRTRMPADARKNQIAHAALTILADDGVRGLTAAAIARIIGVSDATLFRHFRDMNAILDEAVSELEQLLFPTDPEEDHPPLQALAAFLRQRVSLLATRPGVLRVLFSDELSRAGNEATAARVAALRRRSRAVVRELVKRARDAGELRNDLDVDQLAFLVHGLVLALVFDSNRSAVVARFERAWSTLMLLVGPRR